MNSMFHRSHLSTHYNYKIQKSSFNSLEVQDPAAMNSLHPWINDSLLIGKGRGSFHVHSETVFEVLWWRLGWANISNLWRGWLGCWLVSVTGFFSFSWQYYGWSLFIWGVEMGWVCNIWCYTLNVICSESHVLAQQLILTQRSDFSDKS